MWSIISYSVWVGPFTRWSWKHLQNASLNGIFTLVPSNGQQWKLRKTKFWQLWKCNIYPLFLSLWPCPAYSNYLLFCSRSWQEFFKIAVRRICTSKTLEPTTVENMDICSFIAAGKDTGLNHSSPWNVHSWNSWENCSGRNGETLNIQKLSRSSI